MGKMKETQLELFYDDVSPEMLALEDSMAYYDMNPDWNDLGVAEITLEEFDTMVAPLLAQPYDYVYTPTWAGVSEAEQRDYIMWEETKPLTSVSETDMLRKEIAELTETLYTQYKRVADLTAENQELKAKLEQVTSIHTNTRKF